MKQLLAVLFTLVSFKSFAIWETIKGNGIKKTETREIKGFTGISLQGAMNVELAYGNESYITIEADENLLPYIETVVEKDRLVIKTKNKANLQSKLKLVVHASLTRLTSVVLSGSGNITGTGAFNNKGETEVKLSGSGNIKLSVGAISEMDIAISGSGNVILKGDKCDAINAAVSGSGNVDCSDIICSDVTAKISGSGGLQVHATKSIDANVSGSGSIRYKGSPASVNTKSSGSGRIVKV